MMKNKSLRASCSTESIHSPYSINAFASFVSNLFLQYSFKQHKSALHFVIANRDDLRQSPLFRNRERNLSILHLDSHRKSGHPRPKIRIKLITHSINPRIPHLITSTLIHIKDPQHRRIRFRTQCRISPLRRAMQFTVTTLTSWEGSLVEFWTETEELEEICVYGEGDGGGERLEGHLEEGEGGGVAFVELVFGVEGVDLEGFAAVDVGGPVELGEVLGDIPVCIPVTSDIFLTES